MRRILISAPPSGLGLPSPLRPRVPMAPGEAHHLVQVLRLSDGTHVEALDGAGRSCECILRIEAQSSSSLTPATVMLEWVQDLSAPLDPGFESPSVAVALGVLKADAMAWAIEKLVELGASALQPLVCDHSVVRELGPKHLERWQRIADQALKQCGRPWRLEILPPRSVADQLAGTDESSGLTSWWFDEQADPVRQDALARLRAQPAGASRHLLWLGPEGGWSERERALLEERSAHRVDAMHRVSLGAWTLRGETAAVLACGLVRSHFRSLHAKLEA